MTAEVVDVWPNDWARVDAWWCTEHDHASRNSAECTWGRLGACRLAPVYIRTEDS